MHIFAKKLFVVLLTLMAYLPMTFANAAVPEIFSAEQTQSTMDMTAMDDCHDSQKSQQCSQCDKQNCKMMNSSCSSNSAMVESVYMLNVSDDIKSCYRSFSVYTPSQQHTPLLRPPISI